MGPPRDRGWRRLVALDEPITAFLVWIEFLAPAAGLSGLWLVFASPVLFILAVFACGWISAGFQRRAD
jgi:hypothetical protein